MLKHHVAQYKNGDQSPTWIQVGRDNLMKVVDYMRFNLGRYKNGD